MPSKTNICTFRFHIQKQRIWYFMSFGAWNSYSMTFLSTPNVFIRFLANLKWNDSFMSLSTITTITKIWNVTLRFTLWILSFLWRLRFLHDFLFCQIYEVTHTQNTRYVHSLSNMLTSDGVFGIPNGSFYLGLVVAKSFDLSMTGIFFLS